MRNLGLENPALEVQPWGGGGGEDGEQSRIQGKRQTCSLYKLLSSKHMLGLE